MTSVLASKPCICCSIPNVKLTQLFRFLALQLDIIPIIDVTLKIGFITWGNRISRQWCIFCNLLLYYLKFDQFVLYPIYVITRYFTTIVLIRFVHILTMWVISCESNATQKLKSLSYKRLLSIVSLPKSFCSQRKCWYLTIHFSCSNFSNY